MSIREWDIPYEELRIGDKIGSGRFSTVHAGNWHGDVAIKFLDMENLDDENTLEAFRLDVATFRCVLDGDEYLVILNNPTFYQENKT